MVGAQLHRRVRLEHREPAQPPDQPDARAHAGDGRACRGGREGVARADRAARDRPHAEDRRASLDEAGRGVRRGRRVGGLAHVAVAAHAGAPTPPSRPPGARRPRWIPCSPTSSSRRCAVTSRSCASSSTRRATTPSAARRRRAALPRVSHVARQRPHGGLRACHRAGWAARGALTPALRRWHRAARTRASRRCARRPSKSSGWPMRSSRAVIIR